MASFTAPQSAQRQVRLQLTTRDEALVLPQPTGPILVPTSLRRYALSTFINNLLGSQRPVPLEFLINGSYLRTSIDQYLTANGISAESTLAVEYLRAATPPVYVASFHHDDWVSSVDILPGRERILSGSYDGFMRVWNASGKVLATSPGASQGGHRSFVESTKFVSYSQLASSSDDGSIRLWSYTEEDNGSSGTIKPKLKLCGHKMKVRSISVHATSNRILSASDDKCVGFWSTRKSEGTDYPVTSLPSATPVAKKRKLASDVQVPQRGSLALMKQHTGTVTGAIFDGRDSTVGYSTSWDNTVRTWDLVTSALVDTRTTPSALISISHLPALHLLAVGDNEADIKLIDPRTSATTISAMTLKGHKNWVDTFAPNPYSQHGLLSGSYDGTCRIWDVRNPKMSKNGPVLKSMFTIETESTKGQRLEQGDTNKVFGVCWDKKIGIVSANEDKTLQISHGGHDSREGGVDEERAPAAA